MSSFFRNPNDVTDTQDQSDESWNGTSNDESKDDPDGLPRIESLKPGAMDKIETLESTSSDPIDTLTREITRELPDINRNESSEWILRALLEEKCLTDAWLDYEKQNRSDTHYTKDHPDVRELASAKYNFMAETLSKLQVLSPERHDPSALAFKEQTRQGLDMLTSQSPQAGRPSIVHRDESFLRLNSDMQDLVLAGSRNVENAVINRYRDAGLARSASDFSLPSLIRPLIDHPTIEFSRYRRNFTELGMVGKGGYGRVYHARNELDGWNYAIKKITLSQQRIKRIQERGDVELDLILNEIRMLAKFDHPNIARYYGGWLEYSSPNGLGLVPPSRNDRLLLPVRELAESTAAGVEISEESLAVDASEMIRNDSLDIMFEHSGGAIIGDLDELDEQDDLLAELQPQIRNMETRRGSESTTGSIKSKKSSVRSARLEEDVLDADRKMQSLTSDSSDASILFSLEDHAPRLEAKSVLTLHIQMSLYPLSLAEYLTLSTTNDVVGAGRACIRHCFHPRPSLQILLAILDGVEYLHDCGVVHRDLKPSNVFMNVKTSSTPGCIDISKCSSCHNALGPEKSGFLDVRIGDFGLVTEIAKGESHNAIPSRIVGTELYRPCQPTARPTAKLDVYALGIILTELLHPFGTRMERHDVLQQVQCGKVNGETFATCSDTADVSRKLATLVNDMTCPSENMRLSCFQVRERIEELLFFLPSSQTKPKVVTLSDSL